MARRPMQSHTGLLTNNRVLGNPIVHIKPLNWGQPLLSKNNKIPNTVYQPGQVLPPSLVAATQGKGRGCKNGQ